MTPEQIEAHLMFGLISMAWVTAVYVIGIPIMIYLAHKEYKA